MTARLKALLCAPLLCATIGLAPALVAADEFRLESPTLPAPLVDGDKVNVVIEASAVEPLSDGRRYLVAHDKHPALFVVEAGSGRILGAPLTSAHFPAANGAGPKWEGMARDSDGNLYVIGAYTGKTDEERATKSVLIRFRLSEGDSPAIEDTSILRWDIGRSLEAVLKAEGLAPKEVAKRKVEGLTIRELKNSDGSLRRELLVGLRAPTDRVRVFLTDITNTPSPDAELELRRAFSFKSEPREGQVSELTSLEYVPALAGSLVVTASEDESNAFHGNSLWFVPDREPANARKIATFEVAMKAEGMAILGVETKAERTDIKLLITYDNDAHATKIPSRFQTVTLVREGR